MLLRWPVISAADYTVHVVTDKSAVYFVRGKRSSSASPSMVPSLYCGQLQPLLNSYC